MKKTQKNTVSKNLAKTLLASLVIPLILPLTLNNALIVHGEDTRDNEELKREKLLDKTQHSDVDSNEITTLNSNEDDQGDDEEGLTLGNYSGDLNNTSDNYQKIIAELTVRLNGVLNDEQQKSLEKVIIDYDEIGLLLYEGLMLHEKTEFKEANIVYVELLEFLEEIYQEEVINTIDLVKELKILTDNKVNLYEKVQSETRNIEKQEKFNAELPEVEEEVTEETESEGTDEKANAQQDGAQEEAGKHPSDPTEDVEGGQQVSELETSDGARDKRKANSTPKIETFSLSKASDREIYNETNVNYRGILTRSWDGINTKPWGTTGFETIRTVGNLVGREVAVTQEATTDRATWAYVSVVGTGISGWVDTAGIQAEVVLSEKNVNYYGELARTWDGINTRPFGIRGYETIRTVGDLVGSEVRVTKEAVTQRATWAYVEVAGTDIAGWVDKAGLRPKEIYNETDINYRGVLTRRGDGINTKPWGTTGFETIRTVGNLVGREVIVTQEATTDRAIWGYVSVVGTGISGWVDTAGIQEEVVLSEKNVNYYGELTRTWDGISTRPFGTRGYETIRTVGDLVGREVRVTREAVTQRATWAYVEVVGNNLSGWVDLRGIKKEIYNETDVNYRGVLTRSWDGINTKPWGTTGFETIRTVGNLVGREVAVTQEATTDRATWAYVSVVGTGVSGWVDIAGIQEEVVLSEKSVDYKAYLTRTWDGINTKPFGTRDYETIRTVGDLVGSEVQVTREAVTQRSTWAYVEVPGTSLSGWVDKDGLRSIIIYLDPGHGGTESGTVHYGIYEKNLNLSISNKIANRLSNLGYQVIMSRTNDKTVGLYDRPAEANDLGADVFISVHNNAMPGSSTVHGIETYYYHYDVDDEYKPQYPKNSADYQKAISQTRSNESKKIATEIHKELISATGAANRGIRDSAFVVIRESFMPAVLLELGYVSNYNEARKLDSNSYQNTLADAVVKGINNYFMHQ